LDTSHSAKNTSNRASEFQSTDAREQTRFSQPELNRAEPAHSDDDFLKGSFGNVVLRPLALFGAFTNSELNTIYALGEIVVFSALSHIVIEGETTSGMYVILKGSVGIYKGSARSISDHRVTTLSVNKCFGEMSLLDSKPRSATVVADSKTTLFYLRREALQNYLEQNPETALKFYRNCSLVLASRLRDLDEEFLESQKLLWKHAFLKVS
jgi:CRP-like cAMP-binding protein